MVERSSLVGVAVVDQAPRIVVRRHPQPLADGLAIGLPTLGALLMEPRLGLSLIRLTQAGHAVALLNELRTDVPYRTTATLVAANSVQLGEELVVELVTRGPSKDIVVSATASLRLRGPRRHPGAVHDDDEDGDDRAPPEATWRTLETGSSGADLAAALGDHNPLYVDDDAARQAGLPERILPPLGVMSLVASALDADARQARVRFRRPALATDTLRVGQWDDGNGDGLRFIVQNQEDIVVLAGQIGARK